MTMEKPPIHKERKRKNGVTKYLEVKKQGGSSNSFHVNNHFNVKEKTIKIKVEQNGSSTRKTKVKVNQRAGSSR